MDAIEKCGLEKFVNNSEYFYKYSLEYPEDVERITLLVLRLTAVTLLLILLIMHVKSLRVFRWEQSVSGGVLVTYLIAMSGLVLCAGVNRCGGYVFQTYVCATGTALLIANCAAIWSRWQNATELTRAVAEILSTLGVPLKTRIVLKASLSAAAALCLILDLCLVPVFAYYRNRES